MDVDLALLCDAATVDASGKLNILGIFDRIGVKELPARHGRLALVLRFRGDVSDVGEHEVEITVDDPEGDRIFQADGKLRIGANSRSAREGMRVPQIVNFDRMVFENEGRYLFDVKVDGVHQAAVPLVVFRAGGAPA